MPLSERFQQALVYACELHRTQVRKTTAVPYIAHLMSVCAIVLEHGGSEDEAIAAILHDAIEDQGGDATRQEIRRRFGETVVRTVNECTDSDTDPKPPWRVRKEAYVAHLATASPSARLVSAADKLHNARAVVADHRQLGPQVWERFKGGRDGMRWYLSAVVDALSKHGRTPLIDELDRVVREVEALA